MLIPINRDLRDYKVREVGNFSFREAGFIAVAAISIYIMWWLETTLLNGEAFLPSCAIPAMIIVAFGFFRPQNMTLAQYLKTVFVEQNMLPKTLVWESDFSLDLEEYEKVFGEDYAPDEVFLNQLTEMYEIEHPQKNKTQKPKKRSKKA